MQAWWNFPSLVKSRILLLHTQVYKKSILWNTHYLFSKEINRYDSSLLFWHVLHDSQHYDLRNTGESKYAYNWRTSVKPTWRSAVGGKRDDRAGFCIYAGSVGDPFCITTRRDKKRRNYREDAVYYWHTRSDAFECDYPCARIPHGLWIKLEIGETAFRFSGGKRKTGVSAEIIDDAAHND